MKLIRSSRLSLGITLLALLAFRPCLTPVYGQKNKPPRPTRQIERPEPPAVRSNATPPVRSIPAPVVRSAPAPVVRNPANPGPHIEQWMENHKSLPPAEQERALQTLPGFTELPNQTQQRFRQQLRTLNNMSPEQRNRYLTGVEGLERLSPQQQQQWDRAVQQAHALPPQRRVLMMTAVRDLRTMSPDQRQQVIDSPAFGQQFSADERATIRTILTAY